MNMNLQYFGGRGSAGGTNTGISSSKPNTQILSAMESPDGTIIEVQQFSSITGKPTGKTIEYVKNNGRWSSTNKGSFDNTAAGFATLNSKDGVIPEIKRKSSEAAPNMSPKAQKVANNALKSLVFNGGYAEIASNQWSYAGMSNEKVVKALNTLDSKYSYELRTEQTKGLGAARNVTVTHTRIYRKRKSK